MSNVIPFPRRGTASLSPRPLSARAPRDPLTPDECRFVVFHPEITWPDDMLAEAMRWKRARIQELMEIESAYLDR